MFYLFIVLMAITGIRIYTMRESDTYFMLIMFLENTVVANSFHLCSSTINFFVDS